MILDFLGHAAFVLVTRRGTRVLFDPYESGGFSGRVGYAPIEDALPDGGVDVVIITHDHLDHAHVAPLPRPFTVIRHEGRVDDVSVRSVAAFHDREQGQRFGGVVDMKVVHLADEDIVVCHAGDLGQDLEPSHLEALGPIDVLIPPVGGFYTLDGKSAAAATRAIGPRVVVPCHYKTSRCGFDIADETDFVAEHERVERPGGSVWQVDHRDELPGELTCVVLEPRL